MPLRLLARLVVVGVAALIVSLLPRVAHAQMITVNNLDLQNVGLQHIGADGAELTKSPNRPTGTNINLQECRDGQLLRFPLSMTGQLTGDVIQFWAAETGDCDAATARNSSAGTQTCWQIGSDVPVVANVTRDLPVKEIIKGVGNNQTLDASGCRILQNKTAINVYVMLFRNGTGGAPAAKANVPITVKTLGPPPLAGIKVQPGNDRLTISWDDVGEGGIADITGATAYCEINPAPSSASTGTTTTTCPETSTASDASDESETSTSSDVDACTTSTTDGSAAGTIPAPNGLSSDGVACGAKTFSVSGDASRVIPGTDFDKYKCGSTDSTSATSIRAGSVGGVGFTNGTIIAVAVAARDSFGNLGELSDPICQYPEETSDFWNQYRNNGGESGGGFCSVQGPGMPFASAGVLALVFCSAVAALRKRRIKNR